MVFSVDGVYTTTRGCSQEHWEDVSGIFDHRNQNIRCFRNGLVERCLCTGDSCNSANKYTYSSAVALTAVTSIWLAHLWPQPIDNNIVQKYYDWIWKTDMNCMTDSFFHSPAHYLSCNKMLQTIWSCFYEQFSMLFQMVCSVLLCVLHSKTILWWILIDCWKSPTNKQQGLKGQHSKQNAANHLKGQRKVNFCLIVCTI